MMRSGVNEVAVVGVGCTPYGRDLPGRTPLSLALEAAINAVGDAGLERGDIDGLSVWGADPKEIAVGLGLEAVTWWHVWPSNVIGFGLADAANAVLSGQCRAALVIHSVWRSPLKSGAAARDPVRTRRMLGAGSTPPGVPGEELGYAGWMARYMHEHGGGADDFGRIALNARSHAKRNPHAVIQDDLTIDDYAASPPVRGPMRVLDMDLPVDGADAFVVTSASRSRDLPHVPVLLDSWAFGMNHQLPDQTFDLDHTGQKVAMDALWRRSELTLDDVDVFMPYDGYTIIAMKWFESVGYCGPGEAPALLRQHWDAADATIRLAGGVLVNTHGGSLSEGGTQGAGHVREAVHQLRGEARGAQVDDARVALVTPGGLFNNSQAMLVRRE